MRAYRIRKPHFELVDFKGTPRGVMQQRGSYVVVNLVTGEREFAVGSNAMRLTNYSKGTEAAADKEALQNALAFMFGDAAPRSVISVKVAGNA